MCSRVKELESVFRMIQVERMGEVPILNSNLSVEAVGFSDWHGQLLGVLITPWFMNLVLLAECTTGDEILNLPSGALPFTRAYEAQLGHFRFCSLFSPMSEFPDQESARATAIEILRLLLETGGSDAKEERSFTRRDFLKGCFRS